jgi:hypothetical protein
MKTLQDIRNDKNKNFYSMGDGLVLNCFIILKKFNS